VKSIRKNITQPADWMAAFEQQAQSQGQSLSEWAGDCMRANLPVKINRTLSRRPAANRPKKGKNNEQSTNT